MTRALPTLAATFAFLLVGSLPAHAQGGDAGCDPPPELGPSEVTPADRATGVPRNAIIRVRYSPGYFAGASVPTETITLMGASGSVAGSVQLAGDDTLYFVPTATLASAARYTGEATGAVVPFDFEFTTGTTTDVARPDFADPRGTPEFTLKGSPSDGCAGAGSRVRLTFPSARDDGPSSSLEYWVYLTRAEGLAAPVLLTRLRDYGTPSVTAGFLLSSTQSAHAACVSVVAVDGLDRATEWPEAVCLQPAGSLGFVGLCTVSGAWGKGGADVLPILALALGATLLARRRGRARSAASPRSLLWR